MKNKMGKKRKREIQVVEKTKESECSEEVIQLNPLRDSEDYEPLDKKLKWTNRQRVLVFSSRGINARTRFLMNDLRDLMPHSKKENKMDRKDKLSVINDLAEMKNCNKCLYFEAKKKKDLYCWMAGCPDGPSAKFLVENLHTLRELKMTGNCLKRSRPLLSFDSNFEEQMNPFFVCFKNREEPHWALLREMLVQIFGIPKHHPKSQPFIDHVLSFSIADGRLWFRNYQILDESSGELVEIGPRFTLNPIKIFSGSFAGATLYSNADYVSPNQRRSDARRARQTRYLDRRTVRTEARKRRQALGVSFRLDETDDVFNV